MVGKTQSKFQIFMQEKPTTLRIVREISTRLFLAQIEKLIARKKPSTSTMKE